MMIVEAEKGIRHLCGVWAAERGINVPFDLPPTSFHPSFSDFYLWVEANYSSYLTFRARVGVRYMVELWFDDEFKQNWRR